MNSYICLFDLANDSARKQQLLYNMNSSPLDKCASSSSSIFRFSVVVMFSTKFVSGNVYSWCWSCWYYCCSTISTLLFFHFLLLFCCSLPQTQCTIWTNHSLYPQTMLTIFHDVLLSFLLPRRRKIKQIAHQNTQPKWRRNIINSTQIQHNTHAIHRNHFPRFPVCATHSPKFEPKKPIGFKVQKRCADQKMRPTCAQFRTELTINSVCARWTNRIRFVFI